MNKYLLSNVFFSCIFSFWPVAPWRSRGQEGNQRSQPARRLQTVPFRDKGSLPPAPGECRGPLDQARSQELFLKYYASHTVLCPLHNVIRRRIFQLLYVKVPGTDTVQILVVTEEKLYENDRAEIVKRDFPTVVISYYTRTFLKSINNCLKMLVIK